jgi:hypothetical protein
MIKNTVAETVRIHRARLRAILAAVLFLAWMEPLISAELQSETVKAWDRYIQWANLKVQRELSDPKVFLIQNSLPQDEKASVQRSLNSGEIAARRMTGVVPAGVAFDVPSGEIHHWWGAVLLRNVSLVRLLQFLQDYDHHAGRFSDVRKRKTATGFFSA